MKAAVARLLASRVTSGQLIGLGSGSTAELALEEIGKRIAAESLEVYGLATSIRSARIAENNGISVLSSFSKKKISWAFDGADEVDPQLNMIKGRGAAMLSEKIMARRAPKILIIVSEEKLVDKLGTRFAVPVEVVPEALALVEEGLRALGAAEVVLRQAENKYGPVVTEHGNLILDAKFEEIAGTLENEINCLTGVVENGLFTGFNPQVIVAGKTGLKQLSLQGSSLVEESIAA